MIFQCKRSVDEKELQECCEGLNIYPIRNVFTKCSRCRCVVEARVSLPIDILVRLCFWVDRNSNFAHVGTETHDHSRDFHRKQNLGLKHFSEMVVNNSNAWGGNSFYNRVNLECKLTLQINDIWFNRLMLYKTMKYSVFVKPYSQACKMLVESSLENLRLTTYDTSR